MRLSPFLAVFRPALPLILGLSLGCSLSLLMVSWTQGDTDEVCSDQLRLGLLQVGEPQRADGGDRNEEFQPRIVPYHKDPSKPHKKVLRSVKLSDVILWFCSDTQQVVAQQLRF